MLSLVPLHPPLLGGLSGSEAIASKPLLEFRGVFLPVVPLVGEAVAEPLLCTVIVVVVVSAFFSKHLSSPKGI